MRASSVFTGWFTGLLAGSLFIASGCNSDALSTTMSMPGSSADLAQRAPADLADVPDLQMTKSGIGDPCTGRGGMDQGSCNDGQLCIPDPQFGNVDGYCTANCSGGAACPTDATCINFGGNFAFCFLTCTSDNDCRAPDYACQQLAPNKPRVCSPVSMGGGNNAGVPPGTRDGGACVTPVQMPGGGGLFGANTQLTGTAKSIEAECEISVDPQNQNVVVSYNALSANGKLGAIHSGTDGQGFDKEFFLPVDNMVDKNREQSDPVVAIDPKGVFYISWVGFDRSQQNPNPSNMRMYVARSTTGGKTFDQIYQAAPDAEWGNGGFLDKPWIYASPLDGTLYMTWDRQANQNSGVDIRMVRSTDGGKSWTMPVSINDPNKRGSFDRNLAQIAIGADGAPLVTWVEVGQAQFGSTSNGVYLQRFNPDGTALGSNVLVTQKPDSPTFEDPSIAVAGKNVYVGFISGTPKGVWDVRVAASLDGGATFKPSVKVNDDASCATHFHHQIAVDGKGNVHAIWYDNRYLTGNVFHAESGPADANNPVMFGKNQFVNDLSFTFTTRRDRSNWLGDYLGLAIVGSEIYAAWSDNRINNFSHIFFAQGKLPK